MKKKIVLGISLFSAFAAILIIATVMVISNSSNKTLTENVKETIATQKQSDAFVIELDNSPSLGGENKEISLAELEKIEEEKQKEEQEKQEQEQQEALNEKSNQQSQEPENNNESNQNSGEITYPTGDSPYYIKVNNEANVVTIYGKDDNGYYSVPVKAMICSTGTVTPPSYRYPSNKYEIQGRWEWLDLIDDVYGHYATQITGNILFHSVPYTEKWNPGSLEWWEYDKLGTACSAGCVRLTLADAWWIFHYVPSGTTVEFYYDSDPGPLGKPWARQISDNVECRGWDPTDGTEGNPWYKPTPTPVPTATPTATPTPTPTPTVTPTSTPTTTVVVNTTNTINNTNTVNTTNTNNVTNTTNTENITNTTNTNNNTATTTTTNTVNTVNMTNTTNTTNTNNTTNTTNNTI